MAKLNPSVVYSMTRDLSDLQEIGQEMIEKLGTYEIISWRYPDRAGKDIKIVIETELFDTSDYVLLLELLIDRLYFILNMTLYALSKLPEISNSNIETLPKNISKPIGISFGALTAFLWKRLQYLTRNTVPGNNKPIISKNTIKKESSESKEICQNCFTSITALKQIISSIEECLSTLKLESKIHKIKLKNNKLILTWTQTEAIKHWTDALDKDIKSLVEYAKIKTNESTTYAKELNDYKKEHDIYSHKVRLLQKKCSDLERKNQISELKILEVTQVNEELNAKYSKVSTKLTETEGLYVEKEKNLNEIESKIIDIVNAREESIQSLKIEFEKQLSLLSTERDSFKCLYSENSDRIEELEKILNKERLERSEVSSSIDSVNSQNRIFYEENANIKEQNKMLKEIISKTEVQERDYTYKIFKLQEEIAQLHAELKETKDHEFLLLRCPDLNGPINSQHTKNPFEDMKQQLEANELRISLLTRQNEKLSHVINKMKVLPGAVRN